MNIGIVTTWFERGAAYVSKQFEDILSMENNVFIYARGGEKYAKGDPKWDRQNVYWSKNHNNSSFIKKKEFVNWIKTNSIDAVLFNEQRLYEVLLWCKELNVMSVAYVDYYTESTIPLFKAFDVLICNTKRHASAFESFDNVCYIPWGTDIDLYKPQNVEGNLVSEESVTFFNSAGMNPDRKGTDVFIKALAQCKDNKRVKALIHTQVSLTSFFPELKETIEELKSAGMLTVVEETIGAPGLYYMADVYVYPSKLDGIGLTVPEAISSGLACIASDNPPMNEFVQPEYGGLIPIKKFYSRSDGYYWPQCECDDVALADLIQQYADNPQHVVTMKKRAREYAKEHLSFNKNAQQILFVFKEKKILPISESLANAIKMNDNKWDWQMVFWVMLKTGTYGVYNFLRKLHRTI